MRFDDELILIERKVTKVPPGIDEMVEILTPVLCCTQSIMRSEFYIAHNQGFKPEMVFIIHGYEYDGQSRVEHKGKRYKVMRTYGTGFEILELTCEAVIGE